MNTDILTLISGERYHHKDGSPGIRVWLFAVEKAIDPDAREFGKLTDLRVHTAHVPQGTVLVQEDVSGLGVEWVARYPDGSLHQAQEYQEIARE